MTSGYAIMWGLIGAFIILGVTERWTKLGKALDKALDKTPTGLWQLAGWVAGLALLFWVVIPGGMAVYDGLERGLPAAFGVEPICVSRDKPFADRKDLEACAEIVRSYAVWLDKDRKDHPTHAIVNNRALDGVLERLKARVVLSGL